MLAIRIFKLLFMIFNFMLLIITCSDAKTFLATLFVYSSGFLCDFMTKVYNEYIGKRKFLMILFCVGAAMYSVIIMISFYGLANGAEIIIGQNGSAMLILAKSYLLGDIGIRIVDIMAALIILIALELAETLRDAVIIFKSEGGE